MQHTVINSGSVEGRTRSMENPVTNLTGEIPEGPLFLDYSWLSSLYQ